MKSVPLLFQKGLFGSLELPNRIIMSPMVTNFCTEDGRPTERFTRYHEARARGGVGLITVEASFVTEDGRGFSRQATLSRKENLPTWKNFVSRIHNCGTKCSIQISHAGRQTLSAISGHHLMAPSAIPCPIMQEMPMAMDKKHIADIVQAFGEVAGRAKEAGFDAIEILGAHGYLINEFLSPYSNKRTDEYGVTQSQRERFPLEVLDAVRAAVGPDFPVSFRLSAEEFVEGGLTTEETSVFATHLVEHGVSAIHCSGGVYEKSQKIISPYMEKAAVHAENAGIIRKAVKGAVPVFVANRIRTFQEAEHILEAGLADFIVMGRPLLADPELPKKMQAEAFDEIRQCLSCNQGCIDKLFAGEPIGCMINPLTGHEYEYDMQPSADAKRVTVIGGGPAGMEAARAAALKGHHVTLFERQSTLGGQLNDAALPPHKSDIALYIRHQENELKKLGVSVHYNREATVHTVSETHPDKVIIATGAAPRLLRIEGASRLLTAHEVLNGAETGDTSLIIGGGLVGCETAEFLLAQGKKVILIEIRSQIAADMGLIAKMAMLEQFACESQLQVITDCQIKNIDNKAITVLQNGQEQKLAPVDSIIAAIGSQADSSMCDSLREAHIPFVAIGDCLKARQALQAIAEGFDAARNV